LSPLLQSQSIKIILCEDEPVNDTPNKDLPFLMGLIEAGNLTPVIDKTYPLEEAAEAMRYLEAGHARGKVVITVGE
jgi:NADPH:quinone reductase-like Zn-dependent oxidoreductase